MAVRYSQPTQFAYGTQSQDVSGSTSRLSATSGVQIHLNGSDELPHTDQNRLSSRATRIVHQLQGYCQQFQACGSRVLCTERMKNWILPAVLGGVPGGLITYAGLSLAPGTSSIPVQARVTLSLCAVVFTGMVSIIGKHIYNKIPCGKICAEQLSKHKVNEGLDSLKSLQKKVGTKIDDSLDIDITGNYSAPP